MTGIRNRLADIANRARGTAKKSKSSRDASSALAVEARCINKLHEIILDAEAMERAEELEKSARKLDQQLGGQAGGVTRRNEAPAFVLPTDPETN